MLWLQSLSTGDAVVGVVASVSDSGVIATLLCTDTPGIHRDIDELNISVSGMGYTTFGLKDK